MNENLQACTLVTQLENFEIRQELDISSWRLKLFSRLRKILWSCWVLTYIAGWRQITQCQNSNKRTKCGLLRQTLFFPCERKYWKLLRYLLSLFFKIISQRSFFEIYIFSKIVQLINKQWQKMKLQVAWNYVRERIFLILGTGVEEF